MEITFLNMENLSDEDLARLVEEEHLFRNGNLPLDSLARQIYKNGIKAYDTLSVISLDNIFNHANRIIAEKWKKLYLGKARRKL